MSGEDWTDPNLPRHSTGGTWRAPTTWTHRWRLRPTFARQKGEIALPVNIRLAFWSPPDLSYRVLASVELLVFVWRWTWKRDHSPRVDWTRSEYEDSPPTHTIFEPVERDFPSRPEYLDALYQYMMAKRAEELGIGPIAVPSLLESRSLAAELVFPDPDNVPEERVTVVGSGPPGGDFYVEPGGPKPETLGALSNVVSALGAKEGTVHFADIPEAPETLGAVPPEIRPLLDICSEWRWNETAASWVCRHDVLMDDHAIGILARSLGPVAEALRADHP